MTRIPQGATIEASTDSLVDDWCHTISRKSFAHVPANVASSLLRERYALDPGDWSAFEDSFTRLTRDEYMADGGCYRLRRYATLSASRVAAIFASKPISRTTRASRTTSSTAASRGISIRSSQTSCAVTR